MLCRVRSEQCADIVLQQHDIRALVRFELLEAVVRLGIAKYLKGGHTNDVSDAVAMLCEQVCHVCVAVLCMRVLNCGTNIGGCPQNIRPHLGPAAAMFDSNTFRKEKLYK